MKNLYAAGFLMILLFTVQSLSAQTDPPLNQFTAEKPRLFTSLPEKVEFSEAELHRIFRSSVSDKINFKLSGSFLTDGMITEKVQKGKNITSINCLLPAFSNALFNLSMINTNGVIQFTGRIVSRDHGDILMLKKENDKYFFIKQQQKFTMVE